MEHDRRPEAPPEVSRPERSAEQPERSLPFERFDSDRGVRPPRPAERQVAPPPPPVDPAPPPPQKSPVVLEIEHILAEDLGDVYARMSPEEQEHFRREGEEVASRIGQLVAHLKVKTKSILKLIRGWLRLIPGVNQFFLEQEAKIKADQVISLARERRRSLKSLFQIGLSTSAPTPFASGQEVAEGLLAQPILLGVLVAAAGLGVLALVVSVVRAALRRSNRLPRSLRLVLLRVTVPKEAGTVEGQPSPDPKELLARAETLYLNLGNIRPEHGGGFLGNAWNAFWFGAHDQLSFEIVAHRGTIAFYVAVPRTLERLVEQQIHAQYDKAHIEEVEDYNIFSPQGRIAGTYLGLSRRSIFSIRTYRKLDADPLNAVTNAMSKLGKEEGAAVQLVVRPARRGWRRPGQRVARLVQQGKPFSEAMSSVGGGWSLVGTVGGSIFSSFRTGAREEELRQQPTPSLTPMDQELVRSLEEKASKPGFDVNLRLVVSAPTQEGAKSTLMNLVNAFSQYTAQESNTGFRRKPTLRRGRFVRDFIYRHFNEGQRFVLNTEEVTSLFHFPLPTTETPNILWLQARKAPAPVNMPTEGVVLGVNRYRGVETVVRMKPDDRRRHTYLIGMTGVGKSVLMEEMAKQDIREGRGVCVVDPHGSLIDALLGAVPKERADDVIVFDPSDTARPVGLNMLEASSAEERDFAVQEMIAIFYKLFPPEMIGPMFEHNMRNAMLTLMEDAGHPGTIADVPRIFTDKTFQRYKLRRVTDPVVRAFWEKEMAKTSDFHKSEMLGYLVSKVGRFVENAMMRNIIGQARSGFSFREVMDEGKILLVNLSKGKVGEVNASLLGLIVVSKLQMAALARAKLPESERRDFYLYLDEFQNFITDSISTILSEARKYRLNLIMAHQYMGQLVQTTDTKIRDAVLGNVGTKVAFRIGVEDAELLEKEFAPVFDAYDLVNQPRFNAYVKLLIDNSASKAFNLATFPPSPTNPEVAAAIRKLSRLRHGRDRAEVEAEILERSRLGAPPAAPEPSPPQLRR